MDNCFVPILGTLHQYANNSRFRNQDLLLILLNASFVIIILINFRYIYYDEMVFTGVVGTIRTLYAARKYCFYDLARACVNYLENNVCIEHVLKLLKASFDFNEPRLRNLCMRLIINDTFEVLKRKEFKDVHKDLIVQILKQDVLNIREIELFDQVMHWAENECERIGIPVTAMNQRIALGNHNFALIRFPTILPHEFATHIVESGSATCLPFDWMLFFFFLSTPYMFKNQFREI
ncbi:unnamed protein product [Trichobilharzia regenti]|nr:unnamed protein product [Trichobilharzia regenti]